MRAGLLLALERGRGVQNRLAADQGETVVPDAVPLCEAGQNTPCGRPRHPAGENPGGGH